MNLIKKVGIEVEIPVVDFNYKACSHEAIHNLFKTFVVSGWKKKYDHNTKKLIGIFRETSLGVEEVGTDLGVCTLEVALPPINNPEKAILYWKKFKKETLLPKIQANNLLLLGYGNQPISYPLDKLIAEKGHYDIYKNMMTEKNATWFLQNFPGLSSVQFNFEVPKNKVVAIVNVLLRLSPFFWAATANDSVANGNNLHYLSQRLYAFIKLSKGKMTDRFGLPINEFNSLCDYVNRTWEVPIFEIIRNTKSLFPKNTNLTTNQFISRKKEEFISLDGKSSKETVCLEDLKLAIYFSWLDYRIKIFFHEHIKMNELIDIVRSNNDEKLLEFVNNVVIEIRPISMQNNEDENNWLVFCYLIVNHIDALIDYIEQFSYKSVKKSMSDVLNKGLNAKLEQKELGIMGLELIEKLPSNDRDIYESYLSVISRRCKNRISPSQEGNVILAEQGSNSFLKHITLLQ